MLPAFPRGVSAGIRSTGWLVNHATTTGTLAVDVQNRVSVLRSLGKFGVNSPAGLPALSTANGDRSPRTAPGGNDTPSSTASRVGGLSVSDVVGGFSTAGESPVLCASR